MIDHVSVRVSHLAKSKVLYAAFLAPLGYELVLDREYGVGFGPKNKPILWLSVVPTIVPSHIAFVAKNKEAVHNFYEAALAAGARDNGPPGARKIYHPRYYGAFVLDYDGNNLEAVIHDHDG
jgi:catechol 2,3-dioxygenase-like lactoylglutathione lyase family enzyme